MIERALWVGVGGFVGAILRFAIGGGVQRLTPRAAFPYGTLVVNVLGCLAIGVCAGFLESRGLGARAQAFLLVGLLGGFTTFSAFGWESVALSRDADWVGMVLNVGLHVGLGLLAVKVGFDMTRIG